MSGKGHLFILSAPSGTGKTTLCHMILESMERIVPSVSHTTRQPRKNEKHGGDYFFISKAEFETLIQNNHFAEWAQVYNDYYGTSYAFLEEKLNKNIDVLLDIDTQGALQIKKKFGSAAVTIFVMPPSEEELARRLKKRGTESKEAFAQRMQWSTSEITKSKDFDYVVINDNLKKAMNEIKSLIEKYRSENDRS
ncbi:MAG: guanylate kinase [Deltaproteobacteria bacterium]|nr:guanylate kinase [Deltaproteobacteria bacterium]